ncbi:surface-adhesin E family protein [Pandoraea norimbergensis]
MKGIVFALFAAACGTAAAADWVPVAVSKENRLSIDQSTIARDGDTVAVWVRAENLTNNSKYNGKQVAESVANWTFSCSKRRYRIGTVVLYDKNATTLGKSEDGYYTDVDVVPGSMSEIAMKVVCSG